MFHTVADSALANSLDAQAATYQAATGKRMVSLVPGMRHSNPAAWLRPESYDFADSIVRTGKPWCTQTGIRIDGNDDLHTLTSGFDPSLFVKPGNVHYTKEGYALLAAQVAEQIKIVLSKED